VGEGVSGRLLGMFTAEYDGLMYMQELGTWEGCYAI
jgi:hypothetical protein